VIIDYEGILAVNLPNGLKIGDKMQLKVEEVLTPLFHKPRRMRGGGLRQAVAWCPVAALFGFSIQQLANKKSGKAAARSTGSALEWQAGC
jgi:hypothetical protein